jgi:hypothetical protein
VIATLYKIYCEPEKKGLEKRGRGTLNEINVERQEKVDRPSPGYRRSEK